MQSTMFSPDQPGMLTCRLVNTLHHLVNSGQLQRNSLSTPHLGQSGLLTGRLTIRVCYALSMTQPGLLTGRLSHCTEIQVPWQCQGDTSNCRQSDLIHCQSSQLQRNSLSTPKLRQSGLLTGRLSQRTLTHKSSSIDGLPNFNLAQMEVVLCALVVSTTTVQVTITHREVQRSKVVSFYETKSRDVWKLSRLSQIMMLLKNIYWSRTNYYKGKLLLLYSLPLGKLLTFSDCKVVGICLTSALSAIPTDITDKILQPVYMANNSLKFGNNYCQIVDCQYYLRDTTNDGEDEAGDGDSRNQVTDTGNHAATICQRSNQEQDRSNNRCSDNFQCSCPHPFSDTKLT